MAKTDKEILRGVAKTIKQIDNISGDDISKMDQFYIDTARELLQKVIKSSGYRVSSDKYRLIKTKKK